MKTLNLETLLECWEKGKVSDEEFITIKKELDQELKEDNYDYE